MFVQRDPMERIQRFAKRREMVIIQGPRRSGKTTLMKMLMEETPEPKAFINMDRPSEREAFEKNPLKFVEKHLPERRGTLFLDEIQGCRNAGPGLKLIHDEMEEVKVYASGSSSLSLRWDVGTALVGRAFILTLQTFNFHEFLLSRDRGLARIVEEARKSLEGTIRGEDEPQEPLYRDEILPLLEEYLVWGGYPEVVLAEREVREDVLEGIVALYLERDVAGYFRVEHGNKFLSFARLLAHSMGTPVSLASLASQAGISYKTAERYLYILEQSFMVHRVSPFHSNLSTELRKSKKVYFLDLGARNWLMKNFLPPSSREDTGKLLEGFVFRELVEKWREIRYWRTTGGAEVDFVVNGVPVEVKAHGGIKKGFYSFLRAYRPELAVILSLGEYRKEGIGETRVYWVPVWYA